MFQINAYLCFNKTIKIMKADNILRVKSLGNGNVAFVTRRGIVEVNKRTGNMIFYGECHYPETGCRTFYCSGGFSWLVREVRNYANK